MCYRLRTCVMISVGVAGWLALTPATAEAQRGRAIAQAAAQQYLYGGYGRGGYGYPRYYGGYTTAYGNGYGIGNSWNGYSSNYPVYGYNNGGYGYGYNGGYPAYGYGYRQSVYGNGMAYGRGGYRRGFDYDYDD